MDLHLPGRVFVMVQSAPSKPEHYFLKAWVRQPKAVEQAKDEKDQYYWQSLPLSDDAKTHERVACAWSEFPKWFDDLLVWIADYRRSELNYNRDQLQIEVFLPGDLLNREIEQIVLPDEDDGFPIALWREYRVVVRLANRRPKYQADWEQKWQKLEEVCANCALQHLELADCTGSELQQLVEQKLRIKPDVIGVRRSRPPEAQWKGSFLASISRAGLPVAAWVRGGVPDLDYCAAELDRLIIGSLANLPHRIQEARCSEKPIAQHLALLWDDPTCLPPEDDAPLLS